MFKDRVILITVPFIAIMAGGFVPGIRAIMTTYVDSKSQGEYSQ